MSQNSLKNRKRPKEWKKPGSGPIYGESMVHCGYRFPAPMVKEINARAKKAGMKPSVYLRDLLDGVFKRYA